MNRIETLEVLAYLRELFPNGKPITDLTVTVWRDIFSDVPADVVKLAAKKTAMTYRGYTMPAPAELFEFIPKEDDGTEIELWRIAERWIRRGTIMSKDDFDSLPEEIRIYFGGVSAFRDLALLEAEQIPNERARFLRSVPAIKKRIQNAEALPGNLFTMLPAENEERENEDVSEYKEND